MAQGTPLRPGVRATETDFQLGYVTNFLDGAVALQTNAAYQTNYPGPARRDIRLAAEPRQDQVLIRAGQRFQKQPLVR